MSLSANHTAFLKSIPHSVTAICFFFQNLVNDNLFYAFVIFSFTPSHQHVHKRYHFLHAFLRMKAWIAHNCINGFLTILNVPSMYHRFNVASCKTACLLFCSLCPMCISHTLSPSGIPLSSNSKLRSSGFTNIFFLWRGLSP